MEGPGLGRFYSGHSILSLRNKRPTGQTSDGAGNRGLTSDGGLSVGRNPPCPRGKRPTGLTSDGTSRRGLTSDVGSVGRKLRPTRILCTVSIQTEYRIRQSLWSRLRLVLYISQ